MIRLKTLLTENLQPYMIGLKPADRIEVLTYMYNNPKFPDTAGKWKQTNNIDGEFIRFNSSADTIKKLEDKYGSGNIVISGRTNGGDPVIQVWEPAANAQSVSMSDDDILDIILTYTDDPDLAEKQLDAYRETGEFTNNEIEANVLRDPRWKLSEQVDGDSNNNGYPDASENPSATTDIITHDNVSNYYNKPPEGYEFSAKPLTAPARKLLHSYWYNTASASEKEQEIKQDRADGREWKYMQDNYKWLNTYRNRAISAADKLHRGRFLKKKIIREEIYQQFPSKTPMITLPIPALVNLINYFSFENISTEEVIAQIRYSLPGVKL